MTIQKAVSLANHEIVTLLISRMAVPVLYVMAPYSAALRFLGNSTAPRY
jgi:hypothetical protein